MPPTLTRNVWALLPARLRAYEHLKLIPKDRDTHYGNLLFAPPAADAMAVDVPANSENYWVGAKVMSVTEIGLGDIVEVWFGDKTEWRKTERKTGYIVVSRIDVEQQKVYGCWLWRWQDAIMGENKSVDLQDLATCAATGMLFCVSNSGMCDCDKAWGPEFIMRRLVSVKHGPQIAHHDHQAQRFSLNPTREFKGCTDRAKSPNELPKELALGKVLVMADGTIVKKGTLLYAYKPDDEIDRMTTPEANPDAFYVVSEIGQGLVKLRPMRSGSGNNMGMPPELPIGVFYTMPFKKFYVREDTACPYADIESCVFDADILLPNQHRTVRVLDAYAGNAQIGLGVALGIGSSTTTDFVETDPDALETLLLNKPWSSKVFGATVSAFLAKKATPHAYDVIVGGPPCQPYSTANQRRLENKERMLELFVFVSLVDVIRPAYVVLENVPKLSAEPEFAAVVLLFMAMGYSVQFRVMSAAHYGIPQLRQRLILIASRGPIAPQFPEPTHCPPPSAQVLSLHQRMHASHVNVALALDATYAPRTTPTSGAAVFNRPIPLDTQNTAGKELTPAQAVVVAHIPPGSSLTRVWANLPNDVREDAKNADMVPMNAGRPRLDDIGAPVVFGRINATAFVPTVLATYGPRAKSGTVLHPTENRIATVREVARAQGYADGFRLAGSVTAQYKQVGNAFPLPVAYLIGRAIREAMEVWEEMEVGQVG
ncbi:uroporphyrin-III C-methyltransferase [Allomyces arbusculus]|nr:uroporphyrin-III C-methyltransferase [Allomyces arbusculus]